MSFTDLNLVLVRLVIRDKCTEHIIKRSRDSSFGYKPLDESALSIASHEILTVMNVAFLNPLSGVEKLSLHCVALSSV